MVKQPHVLVLQWPAQGHVMSMMQVSQKIVDNGVKLLANLSSSFKGGVFNDHNRIRLTLDYLEELVMKINEETDGGNNSEEKVSCVVADAGVYWAYEPAKKMGLKIAMFCPTSLPVTAMTLNIPKLIQTGIVDENGTPLNIDDFLWIRTYDQSMGKLLCHMGFSINKSIKLADWFLNSFDNRLMKIGYIGFGSAIV
ncbi:hypothetical protein MKX01_003244 [Papaver californicum]|nr:hypothetical protein MKX01_003244 [Papaver californicum]